MTSGSLFEDENGKMKELRLKVYGNLYLLKTQIKVKKEESKKENLTNKILNEVITSWDEIETSPTSCIILRYRELILSFLGSSLDAKHEIFFKITRLLSEECAYSALINKSNFSLLLNEMLPLVLKENLKENLEKCGIAFTCGCPDWGQSSNLLFCIKFLTSKGAYEYNYDYLRDIISTETIANIGNPCALITEKELYRVSARRNYIRRINDKEFEDKLLGTTIK